MALKTGLPGVYLDMWKPVTRPLTPFKLLHFMKPFLESCPFQGGLLQLKHISRFIWMLH